MKKHLLYTGILLATLSLPLSSCNKFLDVKPESKIQDDAIFDNIENLNGYILGLYKDWRDSHKNRIELYAGTDEANMGGIQWRDNNFRKGLETYLDGMNSTNGGILDVWKSRFRIVARASSAISALSPNESSQDNAFNLRLGEACFLRAVNNFELVQMFGAIPLTGTDMGGKRQSIDLVYKSIESDLQKAIQYLPDPADPNYTDLRRATRAIAQAILGKVYLYAPESSGFRDYTKAAEQFEKVYNNPYFGGTGAINYSTIYDAHQQNSTDYKREMVYAFQFSNVSGDMNSIQWDMGSRPVASMTAVEATALFAGFDGTMPSEYCYKLRSEGGVWEEGDVRRAESIRYDFTWDGKKPSLTGYVWGDELDPHVKKYEDTRTVEQGLSSYYSGKNVPFVRFSDVALCYAECLYKIGRQGEAIELINNVVRKRAFGGNLPTDKRWGMMGEEEFMKNLMDERMRELCFEGWRKFDLLRTGLLKQYVQERNRWVSGMYKGNRISEPVTIPDFRLVWPIPLDELRQNPDLSESDQNSGY
ncbi:MULTISPECIES: RagB/SusD family nutrient uptake outer membrane protein [Olivibacter]|uniref:RagB/SusD family nutrient uptake outer membrane protein n=1 Tax=Olivibacter oleidegradans TaxID=760123 RepID=A0ABV6HMA3_9SPHI|nr:MULTISPECIES: RagB/SusD family nutrient uptake outer membrane protein [Olivibacter]MDM8172974.1 RagB/SusD family nutrient uptake outer membrane protein [Olivibacter sp. 47]QEL02774.1 RagB/SusD family nutrient uptake outer membrane protein [Olivibacter sp. LS-1]